MMRVTLTTLLAGAAIAAAVPAAAQMSPPPPPAGAMPASGMMHGPGMMKGHGMGKMFGSMSEAGRATMKDAMKGGGDRKAEHEQVKAARDRMLALLDAERLDTPALKRAMDDERAAASAARERHQSAMLAGFAKLSAADRKAFVADARAMKARMENRMGEWKARRMQGGDMPPPPPM